MTPEQFAYWLQGYSEIAGDAPTPEQWEVIRDHLKLVFEKRTPDRAVPVIGYPQRFDDPPLGGDNFRDWTGEPLPDRGLTVYC